MAHSKTDVSKRRFLIAGLQGAVFVPLAALTTRVARSGDLKPLAADDPTGKALGYHADASAVDKSAFAEFEEGRSCANCVQYQGADGDASGGCAIFPGKSVSAGGWCKVWVAKG